MKYLISITIMLILINTESNASFEKMNIGSRAQSMGNAFVGLADDASAIYWNPAGIAQAKDDSNIVRQIQLMYSPLYGIPYLQNKFIGYTQNRFKKGSNPGAFGIGLIELGLFPNETDGQLIKYIENSFLLSWACSFSPHFFFHQISIGTTCKYYHLQSDRTAFSYGYDAGILANQIHSLKNWVLGLNLGFSIQDIGKSSIWYQGGATPKRREFVESNYCFGMAFLLRKNGRDCFQKVILSADYHRCDLYSLERNKINIGTELKISPNFSLRTGILSINSTRYTFGFGIIYPSIFLNQYFVALDVSLVTHPDLNNTLAFSLSIFNGEK